MPKTPISDLLDALKSLRDLQQTVGKHDEVLNRILDRLDSMDERISTAEKNVKS